MTTGKVLPGAILLSGGIALILCGGCFLIGVMVLISPLDLVGSGCAEKTLEYTPELKAFLNVLYLGAFGCFGAAVYLIATSTRRLMRIKD